MDSSPAKKTKQKTKQLFLRAMFTNIFIAALTLTAKPSGDDNKPLSIIIFRLQCKNKDSQGPPAVPQVFPVLEDIPKLYSDRNLSTVSALSVAGD